MKWKKKKTETKDIFNLTYLLFIFFRFLFLFHVMIKLADAVVLIILWKVFF